MNNVNINDNNFGADLLENVTGIAKLAEGINMEALEPNVQELITRLFVFQQQNNAMTDTLEARATELNSNLLRNDQSVNVAAYYFSEFIEGKGLAEEFKAFAVANDTKVKLMDVEALADDAYCMNENDEDLEQNLMAAGRKCLNLYNALKGSIPAELQTILFSLDNAYGEQLGITDEESYKNGFRDAMKTLNVDNSIQS